MEREGRPHLPFLFKDEVRGAQQATHKKSISFSFIYLNSTKFYHYVLRNVTTGDVAAKGILKKEEGSIKTSFSLIQIKKIRIFKIKKAFPKKHYIY